MRILGLDVSTHLAYCHDVDIGNTNGEIHYAPEADRYARYKKYLAATTHQIELAKPNLVVTEQFLATRFGSAITIVELGTLVRHYLYQKGIPVLEVSPTALKKFVAGTGAAKKNLMLLGVYMNWGFQTANDNIADAYGLWRLGRAFVGVDKVDTGPGIEVVKKLRKDQKTLYQKLKV